MDEDLVSGKLYTVGNDSSRFKGLDWRQFAVDLSEEDHFQVSRLERILSI